MSRKVYPSDVGDEEWEFVVSYLPLIREDAGQRVHALRDVFDAVRWMVKAGCPWRLLPGDFPPWQAVEQQAKRWMEAGCFEAMTHDLRELVRLLQERNPRPTAAIFDGRTMQSSPESGGRAGYDGCKRKKGSKVHVAVDTLGNLLALLITPANEQERAQVGTLAKHVQEATQRSVKLADVDQGYIGEKPAAEAEAHGIELAVVKLAEAKRGFVLLPRRWVVERAFAWLARCRRLSRDYERPPATLAGLHWLAFSCLLLGRLHSRSFVSS
ncbi:MAG: IS5 family transposase [Rhodospirillales bacterium]|nr:IS5 family transposase [Acetobacter sp.]